MPADCLSKSEGAKDAETKAVPPAPKYANICDKALEPLQNGVFAQGQDQLFGMSHGLQIITSRHEGKFVCRIHADF